MSLDKRLAELRARIPHVTPAEARARLAAGEVMIDVRNPGELAQGQPEGAHA